MTFNIFRTIPRSSASLLARPVQPRAQVRKRIFTRTYAAATPGQSSNVANPQASSAESQQVNQSRASDNAKNTDTASLANPVSRPEQAGLGQQEEPTQSQEEMKRDPSEPDSVKRKKVLEKGGNKKLDAADD